MACIWSLAAIKGHFSETSAGLFIRRSRQVPRPPHPSAQRVPVPVWLSSPSPRWDKHEEDGELCLDGTSHLLYQKTPPGSFQVAARSCEPGEGRAPKCMCLGAPEGLNPALLANNVLSCHNLLSEQGLLGLYTVSLPNTAGWSVKPLCVLENLCSCPGVLQGSREGRRPRRPALKHHLPLHMDKDFLSTIVL